MIRSGPDNRGLVRRSIIVGNGDGRAGAAAISTGARSKLWIKVFTWLNEFAKFATFTVVPFDDQVFEEKIYVWKKGDKRKRERVLCGGTNFDAPTRWVNSNNFDGHIVVTDMMAPKPIRSNCQRMWITEESCLHYAFDGCREKVMTL